VEFKAKNEELLHKAVKELGWTEQKVGNQIRITDKQWNSFNVDLAVGKANINQGQQGQLNELKRAYSNQAIKLAAKLGGWQVKNLNSSKGQLLRGVL